MAVNFKFSDMLFNGRDALKTCPELSMHMTGPAGSEKSPARPASARGPIKLNGAAYVADLFLQNKIRVPLYMKSNDSIYVEYETLSERKISAVVENSTIRFLEAPSPNPIHNLVPLLIYAIQSDRTSGAMQYTKETLMKILDSADLEDFFLLSDNFYYEGKDVFGDIRYSTITAEEIAQAIRTRQMVPIPEFQGFGYQDIDLVAIPDPKKEDTEEHNKEEIFERCRRGGFVLDYFWDIDREAYIPPLASLDEFIPDSNFFMMVNLIDKELSVVKERMDDPEIGYGVQAIKDNYVNCQFVGKPGTGKTTIANALGATFGLPVRVVTNSKNTEEDTFQGMTKVQDGGFKFVETPFLDVYKNGGILLLEEYNLSDAGVMMGALGQALEKPFILLEDGYREVRRHPLCVVIATMNTGTQGSREPSEALTSRMPNVFLLDDPDKAEFLAILAKKSGASKKLCNKVYSAYSKIIEYLKSSKINAADVALSITMRHCLAALKQISYGSSFQKAIRNTMIGTIAIKDIDLANDVFDNIISVMPD